MKSLDRQQCRNKLNELFDLICEEIPEIKTDWDAVESYFQTTSDPIPIGIYEKEVVPKVSDLFDYFDIWYLKVATDNQFLVQAMVNKIALPVWFIVSLCNGIGSIVDSPNTNRYCEILVEFEWRKDTFDLKMYTVTDRTVENFDWKGLFRDIEPADLGAESTIFDKSLNKINQEDVKRVHNIFIKLMDRSDCKSKVARFFWMYLDGFLKLDSTKSELLVLPPIEIHTLGN